VKYNKTFNIGLVRPDFSSVGFKNILLYTLGVIYYWQYGTGA